MQDRRAHFRHGVEIAGKLMSPDISHCVDVIVRNLSQSGAMVTALGPTDALPERLYLWQAQTRTLFECIVQWRNSDRRILGLRFTEECSRVSVRDLIDTVAPQTNKATTATLLKAHGTAGRGPAVQVYPAA